MKEFDKCLLRTQLKGLRVIELYDSTLRPEFLVSTVLRESDKEWKGLKISTLEVY